MFDAATLHPAVAHPIRDTLLGSVDGGGGANRRLVLSRRTSTYDSNCFATTPTKICIVIPLTDRDSDKGSDIHGADAHQCCEQTKTNSLSSPTPSQA